jgi:hypothetical protein
MLTYKDNETSTAIMASTMLDQLNTTFEEMPELQPNVPLLLEEHWVGNALKFDQGYAIKLNEEWNLLQKEVNAKITKVKRKLAELYCIET